MREWQIGRFGPRAQRRIKFRAWDKTEHKMYEDVGISRFGVQILELTNNGATESVVRDSGRATFELMQYTGLKDTGGREIYEGDVIKNNRDEYTSYVEFNNGGFTYSECGWEEGDNPDTGGFLHADTTSISWVIGNIYENPELVEAGE